MRSSMITYFFWWCLLASFGGVSKTDKIISVQRGKPVLLFENVGCAGGGVTLNISGNKSYTSIVMWRIENGTITAHRRENYPKLYMDHNQNIGIDSVDESYEGKYSIQCNYSEEIKVELHILAPLSVSIDNGSSVTGVSGGSITVTCSVSGTGTITVTWFGPLGNIISSGPKYTMCWYYYNMGKTSLTIQSQSMSDVGTYTCRASDSNTQLEDSIFVTTAILTAVINEATIVATVGHSSFVNCTVTGSYQSINWYIGNTLLSNGQKYQISQSTSSGSTLSSLTIFNVQYGDATHYVCQAVSSIDGVTTASDSVTLSFGGSSHHLESDSLESDSLESDRITTTYYMIIAVLSVVLVAMILIIILKKKECDHDWLQDQQIATVKKCLRKLTVEQIGEEIQKWLDDHSDFVKKYHEYHEKLTETQIGEENQILLEDPNFMKKNDDNNRIYYPANLPTFDELGVNLLDLRGDIQGQSVPSHPSSDEHDIYYSTNLPTLDELGIRVEVGLTGREDIKGQRVPSHTSSSDYHANPPTLDDLGVTVWTPREFIHGERVPSHPSSVETDSLLDHSCFSL